MGNSPSGRIRSLDGLRGLAAAVVVLDHSTLAIPALGGVIFDDRATGLGAWLTYSPLHALWGGTEAVYVFFILSGFVLTLPYLNGRGLSWTAYYPSRLIRLYLPVIASVALGLALALAVPRTGLGGHGQWIEDHDRDITLKRLLADITLAHPGVLNGPLWSLQWEVAFSVLLPLYVVIVRRSQRHPWILGAAAAALSVIGKYAGIDALLYLPMFLIGGALASAHQHGQLCAPRVPGLIWIAMLGISSTWWVSGFAPLAAPWMFPVVLASTTWIIVEAQRGALFSRFLERPVTQHLGRLSFSLYLVHEPIVVSAAILLPMSLAPLVFATAIPVAYVVSEVFSRLVEMPSHRLARRVSSAAENGGIPFRPSIRRPEGTRASAAERTASGKRVLQRRLRGSSRL